MANTPALTRAQAQYLKNSLHKAGDLIERYVDETGVPVEKSRREILTELIWRDAMPMNKETGEFEIGSWKAISIIIDSDPKEAEGGGNALEAALLKLSEKIEAKKDSIILAPDGFEILTDANPAPEQGESNDA